MKKILFTIALFSVVLMTTEVEAQSKYLFGYRTAETLTSAVAIEVTPLETLTIYTVAADTNITWSAVTTASVIGNRIVIQVTADASIRTMTFGTNITATAETVAAGKTKLFEFIYTGTNYYMLGKLQAD